MVTALAADNENLQLYFKDFFLLMEEQIEIK